MTEEIRKALGVLVVAVIGLVIALLFRPAENGDPNVLGMIGRAIALVCGLVGLILLAKELLRPSGARK